MTRFIQRSIFLLAATVGFVIAAYGQGKGEYYKEAVDNARAGKYELAIKQLTNVLKSDPDHYEAYYNRGFCEAQLHDYATAIKDFNSCLAISPDFPSALYYRGFCFSKLEQYNLAVADYMHALKFQSNSELYGGLAFALLQLKEYEKSLKYYNLAIEVNNGDDRYFFDRATCEYFLNKLQPAAEDIEHYLSLKPSSPDAIELAFRIYFQSQKMAEADKMAKNLVQYKGRAALGYYFEGMVAFDQSQFDQAITAFSAAIKADGKYAEAYFSRGMCYRYLKQKDKACADMNKALSLGFTAQQKAVEAYCK